MSLEFKRSPVISGENCPALVTWTRLQFTKIYMLPTTTVNKKGERTILLKSTGNEKNRYTVVLECMADGTKLPPMIIYKRTTRPSGNFPTDVILHWNAKGWVDEEACKLWVKRVWTKCPGGISLVHI